jgi:diguanylate cyclase (GGDEF)-like protein/PAS domain S-box-containing protein
MVRFSDRVQNDLNVLNKKLYHSEKKYRNIFENVTEGIFRSDSDGRLIELNPAMASILGYDSTEHMLEVQKRCERKAFFGGTEYDEFFMLAKEKGGIRNYQMELYRHDGREISIEISAQTVYDETASTTYIEGILFDVTERKRIHAELKKLADTDGLTGLYNRRYFQKKLSCEISRSCTQNRPLSLIMLDVDHFKSVNDRFGHDVGDRVLQHIAETSRILLREHDIFCRIGGEEFAVILPNVELDKARQVAERMRAAMENNVLLAGDGERVRVTISLGVSQLNNESLNTSNLMKQADEALYSAKNNGRNRVCDYSRIAPFFYSTNMKDGKSNCIGKQAGMETEWN